MTALETHDKVFPFTCSNPECAKAYEWYDFHKVTSDYGFILLSNDETSLFGFTCPTCKKTTVRHYSLSPAQIIPGWQLVDEEKNDPLATSSVPNGITNFNKRYIKFPIENIEGLCQHTSECMIFQPPHQVKPFDYPEWFEDKSLSSVCEKDIERILEFENQNGKCLFPRIISTGSIFNHSEKLIDFIISDRSGTDIDEKAGIYNFYAIMTSIAENHCNPQHHSESSITKDEYQNLTLKYHTHISSQFIDSKIAMELINEYIAQRNNFDSPQTCVNELFNKYLKLLFYVEGYYRSKEYILDKAEYEQDKGKQFIGGIKNLFYVDDPYNHKTLTPNEISERWGRDVNAIWPYVKRSELPAYRHDGAWLDISNNRNLKIDLQDLIFLKSEIEELEVLRPEVLDVFLGKENDKKVRPPINKQVETSSTSKKQPKIRHSNACKEEPIDPKEVEAAESTFPSVQIISQDSRIDRIKIQISKKAKLLSEKKVSFFIRGERGTGKTLFAKALHEASGLKGPFIPVNCSAISENLTESELFGYEKGSHSEAKSKKIGYIEQAEGGTIFLDEIGNLPMNQQSKFLSILEEYKYNTVGNPLQKDVSALIILATNKNIKEMVDRKEFMNDLYDRFQQPSIEIPPLRERKNDIPLLAKHFIEKYFNNGKERISIEISEDFLISLKQYDWEGNVRELERTINNILLNRQSNNDYSELTPNDLPYDIEDSKTIFSPKTDQKLRGNTQYTDDQIISAMGKCNNIDKDALKKIGCHARTVKRRLKAIESKKP